MSKQYNKAEKQARRRRYLKRKKLAVKARTAGKPTAGADAATKPEAAAPA